MAVEQFLLFVMVSFGVSATPGPVMLAAMVQGAHHGVAAAHWGMLGATVGHVIMVCIAAMGIGWVASHDSQVFGYIQWLGAGYLIFLGVQLARRRSLPSGSPEQFGRTGRWGLFVKSLGIAGSNPKGIIYFATVLPPFVDPEKSVMAQLLVLTLVFALIDYGWMLVYASAGKMITRRFADVTFATWFNRITGGAFVGIGLSLWVVTL